jgi:aryl-alcohol dehydrogenase-like predicted oxidoreductase
MRDPQRSAPANAPRRAFLKTAGTLGVGVAMAVAANAQDAPPEQADRAAGSIPLRPFGRHADVKISALGMGGHHLGDMKDLEECIRLIHAAIDSGITFYDNCWEYYNGKTENWLGRGLKGKRDNVFLMTKVCTHGRDASLAMEMLEQSLARLQTDHLDLWQIHGVGFDNDPELAYRKGGVLEALDEAKKQGKVRFVGFSGHKDPAVHLKMIGMGYAFDSVQMPLNPFDANFLSFEKEVLPEAIKRGIAVLGMKSMGGSGDAISAGVLTAHEALRYAMSLPVTTTISGMDSMDVLHQNLEVARNFKAMTEQEMEALRGRCLNPAGDGRFELYKMSLKYDNPQARIPHHFPIDSQQKEVKQMLENAEGASPH